MLCCMLDLAHFMSIKVAADVVELCVSKAMSFGIKVPGDP